MLSTISTKKLGGRILLSISFAENRAQQNEAFDLEGTVLFGSTVFLLSTYINAMFGMMHCLWIKRRVE